MKQFWLITAFFSTCIIPFTAVSGQKETAARDKFTLLTMPYNKRPLTLYKGQFQANAGYKFAVRTKSFGDEGEKTSLKENGSASILHNYYLELKYGITDFIEIAAESFYRRNGIRSESLTYLSGSDVISVNTLNEFKGMGDILLSASFRLPMEYKWFDFSLRGGISLPSAEYMPDQPTHTVTDYKSVNSYSVDYHFNNRNGSGVPINLISAAAKVTYSKLSFEARGSLREPLKEIESIRWSWTLSDTTFSYYNKPYQTLPGRSLIINASIHYKSAGWLDIFLNGNYLKTSGGWTEFYENKYANPETSLLTLEPGFELQISPSITIYQIAGFPLSGRNTDAPFYLLTTISFNMFPFMK
jgi:hypothetical protein